MSSIPRMTYSSGPWGNPVRDPGQTNQLGQFMDMLNVTPAMVEADKLDFARQRHGETKIQRQQMLQEILRMIGLQRSGLDRQLNGQTVNFAPAERTIRPRG